MAMTTKPKFTTRTIRTDIRAAVIDHHKQISHMGLPPDVRPKVLALDPETSTAQEVIDAIGKSVEPYLSEGLQCDVCGARGMDFIIRIESNYTTICVGCAGDLWRMVRG